jgi:excisionase family DNA binding protein
MNDYLMNAQRLARLLGLSRSTVMRYAHAGILPVVRVGNVFRFDYAMVMEALKEREAKNETQS